MNDDDIERGAIVDASAPSDADRPAVVAFDPFFPAPRAARETSSAERYDPHFPTDGASAFD